MSEKPYFRTTFCNQCVNGLLTLLKYARHYYYPIFPWIWEKLSWKKSALVRSKILGLFVNTLTAEYTYSRRNMHTFAQQFQTPLSLKQKPFLDFLLRFWNLHEMENIFKKNESLLALVFPKLLTPKVVAIKCLKSLTSEELSVINLLTGSKHCLNLHGTTIILFFHESGKNWAGKSLP